MKAMSFVNTGRLIIFISAAIISGCNQKITCKNQYITPAFIGFSYADLDSVIVRKYQKGDNFLTLIDTTLITFDTNYLRSSTSNDTIFAILNTISGEEKFIFPDHDWQIYIPATGNIISISNIESPQTENSCFKCTCWNPITTLTQNQQIVSPELKSIPHSGGSLYTIYIRP